MDLSLSTKTALVTGSYRGTGQAIAHTLLAEGATVLVHGLNADQAHAAVD
ncbi:MAG: SDR family NAD(P)-dependent oxidoreductase, partial [Pseudomonadota bacterium]|nr:SDR family NAD(P)-dependent oxidoreductase [Pseudomonadota bacterium]